MSLIVEDGTGLTTAESYGSVTGANKYFADRGIDKWQDYSTTQKEQALRKGTEYIDGRFCRRFRNSKLLADQALEFPRDDSGVLPVGLVRATYEYALRALDKPLAPDLVQDASGLRVVKKQEGLGPLAEVTEYANASPSIFSAYPAADMLLKSLLRPSGVIRG